MRYTILKPGEKLLYGCPLYRTAIIFYMEGKGQMFLRILKKDLKRKRTMNIILLLFIILASMFLASSVDNLIVVNGAIDHFMEISKVPDSFVIALTDGVTDEIDDFLQENQWIS